MDGAAPKMNRGSQSFSLLLPWIFFSLLAAHEEKNLLCLAPAAAWDIPTGNTGGGWSPVTPQEDGEWLRTGKLGFFPVTQD